MSYEFTLIFGCALLALVYGSADRDLHILSASAV